MRIKYPIFLDLDDESILNYIAKIEEKNKEIDRLLAEIRHSISVSTNEKNHSEE